MARRSYLSRLAQPLTAGDPVIASIPRAAAEESRQTVSAAARSLSTLPGPPSSAPAERVAGIKPTQQQFSDRAAPRVVSPSRPDSTARIAGQAAANERKTVVNGTRHAASARRESASLKTEAAEASAAVRPHSSDTAPAGELPPWEAAASPAPRTELPAAVSSDRAESFDPAKVLPPSVRPAKREQPRLHIGSIEVRLAPPPPPEPKPIAPLTPASGIASPAASPAAPIASHYASRFGLAQG